MPLSWIWRSKRSIVSFSKSKPRLTRAFLPLPPSLPRTFATHFLPEPFELLLLMFVQVAWSPTGLAVVNALHLEFFFAHA